MKNILRDHAEWFLAGAGILLAAVILWFMVWGVSVLARSIGRSLDTPQTGESGERFNIGAASELDLRGLEGQ